MPVELTEAESLRERFRDDAPFPARYPFLLFEEPPRQIVEPGIPDLPVARVREVGSDEDALACVCGDERRLGKSADRNALL